MELDKIECTHTKVMTSHSGPIVGMAALRTERVLMTAGADGALQAYCTDTQQLLVRYRFPVAITCILYPPLEVKFKSGIFHYGPESRYIAYSAITILLSWVIMSNC